MRKATLTDLPRLLEIGIKFHKVSGWQSYVDVNLDDLAETLADAIENGCVLIHDYGAIVGIMVQMYFNKESKVAQELFWWAERDGLSLLKGFEEWAKENEARVILMGSLTMLEQERVEKIYSRRGYKDMERFYIKELK